MKNTTLDVNFRAHFRTDKAGLSHRRSKVKDPKNKIQEGFDNQFNANLD